MSTTELFQRAFAKSMFRAGSILAVVLVLLAILSPLMSQFGSNVQYFSQVGVNGGSTTSFTINNPSATETITVDVQLYLPDGTPLADGQVELGPGATETLTFGDPKAALTSGWAELKSDGAFIATEFFQLSIGGELKPRVGVLPSVASDEIRFLGFVNPQFTSGLAVTNPSSTEATEVTIRAKDNAGQAAGDEKTFMLEPLHSVSGFLNEEKFLGAGLSNYEGVVEISVNSPAVAALSLTQDAGTGDVATVSVLTQSHIITTEDNTALGIGALVSNTTGSSNTATGASALFNNTEGSFNTASGAVALVSNTTGVRNTATGAGALTSNTTGERNTASGDGALAFNTTGSSNITLGFEAGLNLTTGSNGIYIGNDGEEGESSTTRIGDSDQTRTFISGIRGVTTGINNALAVLIDGNGQLGTVSSSLRYKKEVRNMGAASEGLMRLRPVTFRYKQAREGEGQPIEYGLIAEEVAEEFPDIVVYDDAGRPDTVQYRKVNVMLLNELQGQYRKIQEQEAVITDLTERLSRLEQVLSVPRS